VHIQDAAGLPRARPNDDKLLVYQQKIGTPRVLSTAEFLVGMLHAVENDNDHFFFYDGVSQPESMVKCWDRVSQKAFRTAKPPIKNGHRIAPTFAV
jgi:hypothetical protein